MPDAHPMALKLAHILAKDPQLAFDFYRAASEVVDDFEDYDGIMPNDEGVFDETTAIKRLMELRNQLIARLSAPET